MARADLPREARVALDYDGLVSTLDMIDGEPVIVRIAAREDDGEATARSSISIQTRSLIISVQGVNSTCP